MNEKMIQALEAGLHHVLYVALRKADSTYPLRDHVTTQYLMHRDCLAVILSWFEQQVTRIRRLRFSLRPIPIGRRSMRPHEDVESYDEWDILLNFFRSASTGWMITVALSSLPHDIRQLLANMANIIEVAFDGGIQQCLNDLQVLAYSLAEIPEDREMLEKYIRSVQLYSNESMSSKSFRRR